MTELAYDMDDWESGLDEYEAPEEASQSEIPDFEGFDDEQQNDRGAQAKDERSRAAQEQVMPGVTPGALIEAMENPEVFAEIARGDLYVQMTLLRKASQDPRFTPNQRMEYSKFLARMGKVEQPENDGANPYVGLPVINITFPGSGRHVQIEPAEKDITPQEDD